MSTTTDWTREMVLALGVVSAAIVFMFGLTSDVATRDRLIDLFEALVALIVGTAAGAAVGWYRGFQRGFNESEALRRRASGAI